MKCEEARQSLYESLDGELGLAEEQVLHEHIETCSDCAATQATLRLATLILEDYAEECTPDDFTSRVMSRLPASSNGSLARLRRGPRVAAMLCLVLLGGALSVAQTLSEPQLILADQSASVIQQGSQIFVPAGETVQGDVTVYGAQLVVSGQITGDLHLVGSTLQLEEGGSIAGQVIDQAASPQAKLRLAMAELWDDLKRALAKR